MHKERDPLQPLIAHYLAALYPAALPSFLAATGLPEPDLNRPPCPDLRTLAEDYLSQHLARRIGDTSLEDDAEQKWSNKDIVNRRLPPDARLESIRASEGITAANLLAVVAGQVPQRRFDTTTAEYISSSKLSIITTSVDKGIYIIDYATGEVDQILHPHKSAALALAQHPTQPRYLLSGAMDGTTVLTDMITQTPLQTFKSGKFVVRTVFSPDGRWFATASYDKSIVIYEAVYPTAIQEDEPDLRYVQRQTIQVDFNPEALLFHPRSEWLMYTTRSSHLMHYVRLPDHEDAWKTQTKSFNPHPLDNHISFAVLNMAIDPSGKVMACQTGDHAGNSGERILLYGIEPDETERLACIWTGGDTDDFVLPRMAWLQDGSGLITTSPTGFLRLLSLQGEVRSHLKVHGQFLGQQVSQVVRDCCVVGDEVVSVGYDRTIRFTKAK